MIIVYIALLFVHLQHSAASNAAAEISYDMCLLTHNIFLKFKKIFLKNITSIRDIQLAVW